MNIEDISVERRATVHAALGDPARLAVVDNLVLGDRSPSELAGVLHLASNLLAHHLHVLEAAGLIERTRSEADRRRTYVRLVPETLEAIVPAPRLSAPRVVFVCSQNSARSQLAAALWSRRSALPAASAGTDPSPRVHRRAVSVARRHGLSIASARTASVSDVVRPDDLVVAVCDSAYEELGPDPAHLHWSVPDPVHSDDDAAFERAYAQLDDRVDRLAKVIHPTET